MDARPIEDVIKGLTPLRRARVAEELYDIVFAHVSVEAVLGHAGSGTRDRIAAGIERHFVDGRDDVVQRLLLACAQDRTLEPILREALTAASEAKTLSIRSLLTAGMLINLTLFVATTEVEVKNDPQGHVTWSIDKKIASPELIKPIVEGFLKTGQGVK